MYCWSIGENGYLRDGRRERRLDLWGVVREVEGKIRGFVVIEGNGKWYFKKKDMVNSVFWIK